MTIFDSEGFLKDRDDWSEAIAGQIANDMGIDLDEHISWYILKVRQMYEENGTVPPLREFSKETGGDRKGTHLNKMFNGGPMKKLCRLAGLPKPTGCV